MLGAGVGGSGAAGSRIWLEFPTAPVCWCDIFGNRNPVELEIGSGKGLFLANAGRRCPEVNFLGVELAAAYAARAVERVGKLGLENVRLIRGDGRRFLSHFVPAGSLRGLHLYFPDPWWKKRHWKRRVFTEEFVREAARALESGGKLHLATDVEESHRFMERTLGLHGEFERLPDPEAKEPEHELDYLTSFERKYRLEGRAIYRAEYRLARSS
jgi:tRNA (guanine-N7-)-methyltransferase